MRQALGREKGEPAPAYALLEETLPEIQEKAIAVRQRLEGKGPELVHTLGEVSELRGWKVCHAAGPEEALGYICDVVRSSATGLVVRSDQEVFETIAVDDPLQRAGVQVVVTAQGHSMSREELRRHSVEAGVGITGVDYAIAETGSVVLLPRRGLSRLSSLAPTIHVAIVRPDEVVESLDDLFILRRLAYHTEGDDAGMYMNFITGPSRTTDIEQTLVIGVHGPQEAHMVLLG